MSKKSGSGRPEWQLPSWFQNSYNILVIEVFILIAVGGSVRIMNAGLACPDWPLCFGEYIPDYHPQVYFEFIHRVMAGIVSISLGVLNYFLFRSRAPRSLKTVGYLSIAILIAQIVFGGLTVRMLLSPPIVATHLFLGTAFFLSLLWIYLTVKTAALAAPTVKAAAPLAPRVNCRLFGQSAGVFVAVYIQVILGGMVAANFASLVCIDFPTCHGEWFPTFSGIIGLHMIHRYWAYCLFLLILSNLLVLRKSVPLAGGNNLAASQRTRKIAGLMFAGVGVQVCLGIANVLLLTPPLIAVLHLATGVTVLSLALRQIHSVLSGQNGNSV